MIHLGLFEGFGGFALAAKMVGWETKAWCEIDTFCQQILRYHFPEAIGHSNIKETDFTQYANKIDILTGGFPCQPYSTAGLQLGTADDRHLWPEMLRAIREAKPTWVVGENVRGLVSWNRGMVFNQVQTDLEAEGYEVQTFLLPAAGVGAPHQRYRIWFVAYSNGKRTETSTKGCNQSWQLFQKIEWEENKLFDQSFGQSRIITNSNIGGLQRTEKQKERQKPINRNAWGKFPTQSPICSGDDGVPGGLDGITFSKWREQSIKGFGNAVVPHLVFEMFKVIDHLQKTA